MEGSNIIMFDGEKKNWNIWSLSFKDRDTISGYDELLTSTKEAPPESSDTNEKSYLILRKMNKIGYCEFLLDMKTQKCIQIVSESRTKDLPSGYFYNGWNNLNSVYKPNDLSSKIEFNENLENLKLNPFDDTDDCINKMGGYRR